MKAALRFSLIFFLVVTQSIVTAQNYSKVNINNVSTFVWNNGVMDNAPNGNSGFEYWKGTKIYSVYSSGLYWGGYINNELRVGGARYTSSLRAGFVNSDGTPNLTGAFSQVYRIRPDYKTASLHGEMNDENKTEEEVRKQYALDYENWPVQLGAPFYDTNKNGLYDKGKDIPGFPNSDQTLWFISNDIVIGNDEVYQKPFISKQTNIELQTTVWAYSKNEFLKGVVFKKYKLINKSKTQTIKDMHIGMFCDSDLAFMGNDCNGCDTTLNLGYSFNGNELDYNYVAKPPVMGFLLLKGAYLPGSVEDQIFVDGKRIRCKKDLLMTSFSSYWPEYTWGVEPFVPTLDYFYYQLKGLSRLGLLWSNPITGIKSSKQSSGDPVKGTGWLDYSFQDPGDRTFVISTGPFNMAPGDTQEVIFAQIVTSGTSRLGLVSYLKYLARYVNDYYENEMFRDVAATERSTEIPMFYSLEQNYPNPFNPSTTIEYTIPKAEYVTLKVYDLLGREVATLVDEYKNAANYKVTFNVETRHGASLHSGVFFYTLTTNGFTQTKKMLLIK